MQNKIEQACKKLDITFPMDNNLDMDYLTYELESEGVITFTIHYRESVDGSDGWLQAEYWSEKVRKTIIWDYDYPYEFEDIAELIEQLEFTQAQIEEFENKIIIKK